MINVVLYQPEKPQNTGNIMRTCVATNVHLHIIGPLTFTLDEKSLKRAGMDYIQELKYTYYNSLEEFFSLNKNINIYFITRYGNKSPDLVDFSNVSENVYVMFGRESTGIPHDLLRDNLDKCLRLPMVPSARSLNLSNTVAIVVYEILRQQNYYGLSTYEAIKGKDFLMTEVKEDE
ncbi:MAG: tRNA (cytidine(34)-2'-O)-methyltransferase [Erysipelotrichales bacterium]|nr:tRNA (cytidine(34)-2'-O)-methyltransferase [Erysipelotrichales bacterium]